MLSWPGVARRNGFHHEHGHENGRNVPMRKLSVSHCKRDLSNEKLRSSFSELSRAESSHVSQRIRRPRAASVSGLTHHPAYDAALRVRFCDIP